MQPAYEIARRGSGRSGFGWGGFEGGLKGLVDRAMRVPGLRGNTGGTRHPAPPIALRFTFTP